MGAKKEMRNRKACLLYKSSFANVAISGFKESFGGLTPSASIGHWHRNLSAHGDLLQVAILVFSVQGETYKRLRF